MTPRRLRIVLAEDAAIMRDGLTQTLTRRGLDVVAAVADPDSLHRAVTAHQPDVAIVDVRMPPQVRPAVPQGPRCCPKYLSSPRSWWSRRCRR